MAQQDGRRSRADGKKEEAASEPRKSVGLRREIVNAFRRDLVGPGPGPEDADLAEERLSEAPSRWYLTGFIAPALESPEAAEDDPSTQEEMELGAEEPQTVGAGGAAGDQELPEAPVTRHRFHP